MTRYSPKERSARFKRLAATRTNTVMDKLRILSNCANPQLYEYSDKEVKQIFDAIEDSINLTKTRFERRRRKFNWLEKQ